MKHDIVYILRKDIDPYELTYSLRSLKNFPHGKVWFVGGQPKGLKPDGRIRHEQSGRNKWSQIESSMWKVIENDEVTDDFFLFNDDFFIMKPFEGEFVNYIDGTLSERIEELHSELGLTAYCRTLLKVNQELKYLRAPTKNFEVHLPMLVNKEGMAKAIKEISSPQMRSAYGNFCRVPFVQHKDVKVYDMETVPENPDFLSTNDETFKLGKVGEYIRQTFNEPSRFEVKDGED